MVWLGLFLIVAIALSLAREYRRRRRYGGTAGSMYGCRVDAPLGGVQSHRTSAFSSPLEIFLRKLDIPEADVGLELGRAGSTHFLALTKDEALYLADLLKIAIGDAKPTADRQLRFLTELWSQQDDW